MKTVKQLVDKINESKIHTPYQVDECIDMDGVQEVGEIGREEHRWYTLSTVVFMVRDEYFGVFGPVSLKSEGMSWEDTCVDCEAFEMEQVISVSYRRKDSV